MSEICGGVSRANNVLAPDTGVLPVRTTDRNAELGLIRKGAPPVGENDPVIRDAYA